MSDNKSYHDFMMKRFAVWRIGGEWQAASVPELEAVGMIDLSRYFTEMTVRPGWTIPVNSLEGQHVVFESRETGTHYALFYMGDYEAVSDSIPSYDYLRVGTVSYGDFTDITLVKAAVEAVKAYEQRLKGSQEAERKFEEIKHHIQQEYEEYADKIERKHQEDLELAEKVYRQKLEQARRDLGLRKE